MQNKNNNHPDASHNDARRRFLQQGSSAALGVWLSTHWGACLASAEQAAAAARQQRYQFLNPHQSASLDAISAQLIPTTDTPGAREAGVVNFFDQALSSHAAFAVEPLNGWITELDAEAARLRPGSNFHQLDAADQQQLLTAQEDTPAFGLMRFLTVVGMFAMSHYGGNKNNLGWELLGFDHRHAWQPPFGYYDAEYARHNSGDGA